MSDLNLKFPQHELPKWNTHKMPVANLFNDRTDFFCRIIQALRHASAVSEISTEIQV